MSRYSLKPLPHRSDVFEVAVGWDPGFGTYFAIVFGVPEAAFEPAIKSWQGRTPGQLATVTSLEVSLRGCAQISPELLSHLAADKRTTQARPGRQLSKAISALLR